MGTKLSLRIHRVKCVDETGGRWVEKIGNDEIYLGGFSIMPNGDTSPISVIPIYPHFDDGDVKVFNPPKHFFTFSVPQTFPADYGIGLVLIEKDNGGGASSAILQITQKAQELIKDKLPIPAAGGILGTVLTTVAAPLLSYILGRIVAGIRDDLFPPQMVAVSLTNSNHSWFGSNNSTEKTLRVSGHGGIYELTYDWEFV